mmetsp:Transcript_17301/g.49150  ORF Transcript_17301/g.49150 Transcript_17301/m.49150 type:complete len:203 (-) Transcript_17301:221-829(-)
MGMDLQERGLLTAHGGLARPPVRGVLLNDPGCRFIVRPEIVPRVPRARLRIPVDQEAQIPPPVGCGLRAGKPQPHVQCGAAAASPGPALHPWRRLASVLLGTWARDVGADARSRLPPQEAPRLCHLRREGLRVLQLAGGNPACLGALRDKPGRRPHYAPQRDHLFVCRLGLLRRLRSVGRDLGYYRFAMALRVLHVLVGRLH